MTAAHCINSATANSLNVKFGGYDRGGDDTASLNRNVQWIHRHPQYNAGTMRFDFAILELDTPVPFTDCIAPVCLPEVGEVLAPSVDCWITGWGTLNSGGSQPQYLQEAVVKSKSNAGCNSAYSGRITDDMLCASGHNSQGEITDACQGDSGGPLVCDDGSGRFVLHGATSWGRGCADVSYPGVWARVEHELQWIYSVVGTPGTSPPTPVQPTQSPTQPTDPPSVPPTNPPTNPTNPPTTPPTNPPDNAPTNPPDTLPGPPGPSGPPGPPGPPGVAGPVGAPR